MMKMFAPIGLAVGLLIASGPALAEGQFYGELNYADTGNLSGGEIGAGYSLLLGPVSVRPIGGLFMYQGENDRYRSETFSNGNEVCRDLTNGQFADKENCDDLALKVYGKLEATFTIADRVEIGGGARVSDDVVPYGTVGVRLSPTILIKGSAGKDYYSAGLAAKF